MVRGTGSLQHVLAQRGGEVVTPRMCAIQRDNRTEPLFVLRYTGRRKFNEYRAPRSYTVETYQNVAGCSVEAQP